MGSKKREGGVYSTNPDFDFQQNNREGGETLPASKQLLYIWLESKGRNGKTVTLVKGFIGQAKDLESLAGELKRTCGTGGSVKDQEIVIQGDFREKVIRYLNDKGYKTKKAGG
jgi:translation initiation factor 1